MLDLREMKPDMSLSAYETGFFSAPDRQGDKHDVLALAGIINEKPPKGLDNEASTTPNWALKKANDFPNLWHDLQKICLTEKKSRRYRLNTLPNLKGTRLGEALMANMVCYAQSHNRQQQLLDAAIRGNHVELVEFMLQHKQALDIELCPANNDKAYYDTYSIKMLCLLHAYGVKFCESKSGHRTTILEYIKRAFYDQYSPEQFLQVIQAEKNPRVKQAMVTVLRLALEHKVVSLFDIDTQFTYKDVNENQERQNDTILQGNKREVGVKWLHSAITETLSSSSPLTKQEKTLLLAIMGGYHGMNGKIMTLDDVSQAMDDETPLLFPISLPKHAVGIAIVGDYFFKINRGDYSDGRPGIHVFKITDQTLLKAFIARHENQFLSNQNTYILNAKWKPNEWKNLDNAEFLTSVVELQLKAQDVGNCFYVTQKALVLAGMIGLMLQQRQLSLNRALTLEESFYEAGKCLEDIANLYDILADAPRQSAAESYYEILNELDHLMGETIYRNPDIDKAYSQFKDRKRREKEAKHARLFDKTIGKNVRYHPLQEWFPLLQETIIRYQKLTNNTLNITKLRLHVLYGEPIIFPNGLVVVGNYMFTINHSLNEKNCIQVFRALKQKTVKQMIQSNQELMLSTTDLKQDDWQRLKTTYQLELIDTISYAHDANPKQAMLIAAMLGHQLMEREDKRLLNGNPAMSSDEAQQAVIEDINIAMDYYAHLTDIDNQRKTREYDKLIQLLDNFLAGNVSTHISDSSMIHEHHLY